MAYRCQSEISLTAQDDLQDPSHNTKQMPLAFAYFTEVGIINQLSTALFAKILPDGIHPSHFSILNHLTLRGDNKTPVRIAEAMQVTKNTMTHSLKVLSERGYVRVAPHPDDGRAKSVFLTEEGRAFRERAIAQVLAEFHTLLGPEQMALMERCLDDLRAMRVFLDDNRR